MNNNEIVLENEAFSLILTDSGVAKSLVLKSGNKECLALSETMPFFSLTEERPYNNEIKLAYPTRRMTFNANRVRMESGRLIVGFELIDFEAVIGVVIKPGYMIFELQDFIVKPDSFGLGVVPILPPVSEFRLVQLPLKKRKNFGSWLNVLWDEEVAVNVLSACPYPVISSEERRECRMLYGQTLRDVKLKNAGVGLIVSKSDKLLDVIDAFEKDNGLPLGVESRRMPLINRSYYWNGNITPGNVDEHIGYALKGGFKYMSLYYTSFLHEKGGYNSVGEYGIYRKEYPNGISDLEEMLKKIKAAGIIPGLHILHTHIGMSTKYMTPRADHRINLTKRFTLAAPLNKEDTTVYVEECPQGCPTYEKTRVLRFMGELIQYESYTEERPYCFTGCKRGYNDTLVREHEMGTIGGIVDISEFCANSAYIDQSSSLQDEIADEIAEIYNKGFEFMYFDGSEGTEPPFDVNVGLAQYKVYKKLLKKPLFCEGAAKSHFSWHMLSGGNAFDAWGPDNFKKMIAEHPCKEAPLMANDFTRLNFGWWAYRKGQRADIFEYGTALGAAWDCPGAFMANIDMIASDPRSDDILETFRRWEQARASGFITPEIKAKLRDTSKEHTLLMDKDGKYLLAEYEQVNGAAQGSKDVCVFVFELQGHACAVCWCNTGKAELKIDLGREKVRYLSRGGKDEIPYQMRDGKCILPLEEKRYLITELPLSKLKEIFEKSELI